MPITTIRYHKGIDIGKSAYVDTNFLLSVVDISKNRPMSPKLMFADLLSQGVMIFISSLALDEAWFTLLYELNNHVKNLGDKAKKQPEIYLTPHMPVLNRFMAVVSKWPRVEWVGFSAPPGMPNPSYTSVTGALNNMSTFQLMPRDAFHLQFAHAFQAENFVTADRDFERLRGRKELSLRVINV